MKKIRLVVLAVVILAGCAKEYSFESPIDKSLTIVLGNNCSITKIIDYDTIAQRNVYMRNANWNQTGNYPITVSEVDSLTMQNTFSKNITLIGDTFKIDANQYFLVDIANNYRVREFVGKENPYASTTPIMRYRYLYDVSNRLITKLILNPQLPGITVAETNYKYSAGDSANLIEIKTKIPINNVTYYEANLTYNTGKEPKNFIYTLVDSKEIIPYMQFFNFGKKPKNELQAVTVKNYDQVTATLLNTTQSQFDKYVYTADGYVLQLDCKGTFLPALGLFNSRNKFQYYCR